MAGFDGDTTSSKCIQIWPHSEGNHAGHETLMHLFYILRNYFYFSKQLKKSSSMDPPDEVN